MKNVKIARAAQAIKGIHAGEITSVAVPGVEGYSGKKLIASLQQLTQLFCTNGTAYLELGVFRGLTLISNAHANPGVPCYGIDNFSLFDDEDDEHKNLSIIQNHLKRLKMKNVAIINSDFDDALDSLGTYIGKQKVGVFFVDGPHDYRSQLVPLLKIVPYLADECAIVVDDANYPHVRQATNDFLRANPDFALLAQAYTSKHIANMSAKEKEQASASWWDGVNIIVRDGTHAIERKFATEQQKHLFPASHDLFRHELATIAFDLLKLAQRLADAKQHEGAGIVKEMKRLVQDHRTKHPDVFPHRNTYSSTLPAFAVHTVKR